MKILHLIPSLRKGGAERLAINIVQAIQDFTAHEACLVSFHPENEYAFLTAGINWKQIPSKAIPSLSGKADIDVKELQAFIDSFQPDILHSHLFETEMVLAYIQLPKNTKRVLHFHDNMPQLASFRLNTFLSKQKIACFYEKKRVERNLPKNTTAIGISQDAFTYAQRVLPTRITKVLLKNAIDLKRFENRGKQTEETEPFRLCMIGSLVPKKGQSLAIETVSELKKRGFEVRLDFIGTGADLQQLKQLSKSLDLEKEIIFNGNQDFPEQFLQKATIYLHTASYEPFGLVLIEAMACGLPVVCTDGKGNRDLIHEGENGFVVWERDPNLLAEKIQFLIENEAERERMGENARIFAQDFGMEKYVEKLLEVYSK